MLWHANQMARYNLLRGLKPPDSGHWRNNPEADDIDFQIEADFIGLMTPGLPNAATAYADKVGHIMNSGDGWYGGVFVAAMYSLAFVHDDVRTVVTRALDTIPAASRFHKTVSAVIRLHDEHPTDWKRAWFELQRQHSEDIGCPDGVFAAFNIDARLNAAYVVLGLLYGDGDMSKTISVATRAGQDSDCNPATAAGVLGTILGYQRIPAYWKQGLAEVEDTPFKYTTISLNDAYALSYKHALDMVRRAGGREDGDSVVIPVETPKAVRLEQNFEGHYPVAEVRLARATQGDETRFTFDGIGFAIQGDVRSEDGKDHVLIVDMYIDEVRVDSIELPTNVNRRKFIPFWKYELTDGSHTVRLKVRSLEPGAALRLQRAIIYGRAPKTPEISEHNCRSPSSSAHSSPCRRPCLLLSVRPGPHCPLAQPRPVPRRRSRATGNEPGWTLDIGGSRLGCRRPRAPGPGSRCLPAMRVEGGRRDHARTEAHTLVVTILERACADTMTGMPPARDGRGDAGRDER